jgi:hypothetical protein
MSKNETNRDAGVLPKPVVLTPEEVHQVAAGSAAALPSAASSGGTTTGAMPPPDPLSRELE